MTSWRSELALAAARTRELGERIPEQYRPDLVGPWTDLLDALDHCRSDGGRLLAILEYRERTEAKLSSALAHAPLEGRSR